MEAAAQRQPESGERLGDGGDGGLSRRRQNGHAAADNRPGTDDS
jgi:hypothetical protein